jgi:hypothetical protein
MPKRTDGFEAHNLGRFTREGKGRQSTHKVVAESSMLGCKDAKEPSETVPDAVVWAICPHITRWSDSNWHEYAPESQRCHHCPESETIDGYEVVCPWRGDAEEAAKAVLQVLPLAQGKSLTPSELVEE